MNLGDLASAASKQGWVTVSQKRRWIRQEGFHVLIAEDGEGSKRMQRHDLRNALCIRGAGSSKSDGAELFLATGRKPTKLEVSFSEGDGSEWLRIWCSAIELANVARHLQLRRDENLARSLDCTHWNQKPATKPGRLSPRWVRPRAAVLLSPRAPPPARLPTIQISRPSAPQPMTPPHTASADASKSGAPSAPGTPTTSLAMSARTLSSRTFKVAVPQDVPSASAAGTASSMVVSLPTGERARVALPPDAKPGTLFSFKVAERAVSLAVLAVVVSGDEGGPQVFGVQIPQAVTEGGELRVMTPYGMSAVLPLPQGAQTGEQLTFTAVMPPASQRMPCAFARPAPGENRFEVTVPARLTAGSRFKAILPSAEAVLVTTPEGAGAGAILSVDYEPNSEHADPTDAR
jgi:hypothetical protein